MKELLVCWLFYCDLLQPEAALEFHVQLTLYHDMRLTYKYPLSMWWVTFLSLKLIAKQSYDGKLCRCLKPSCHMIRANIDIFRYDSYHLHRCNKSLRDAGLDWTRPIYNVRIWFDFMACKSAKGLKLDILSNQFIDFYALT